MRQAFFLFSYLISGYLIVILLIFCIKYADNLLTLKGFIVGLFPGERAQKTKIASAIRSGVVRATKEMCISTTEILPSDLKIKWADVDTPESF
ncbi:MAG: hypothetical protein FWF10_11295, partial [Clostridiales bacterium]|nr:hypothetical protein [Clostridiales bacterium]